MLCIGLYQCYLLVKSHDWKISLGHTHTNNFNETGIQHKSYHIVLLFEFIPDTWQHNSNDMKTIT